MCQSSCDSRVTHTEVRPKQPEVVRRVDASPKLSLPNFLLKL